jgi:hypothetical protein
LIIAEDTMLADRKFFIIAIMAGIAGIIIGSLIIVIRLTHFL